MNPCRCPRIEVEELRAGQAVVVKEVTRNGFKVAGEEKNLLKENYLVRFEKMEEPADKGGR